MPKPLTAADRKSLVKLAGTLPKGSAERRAILAGLRDAPLRGFPSRAAGLSPQQAAKEILKVMALDNELDPDYLTRTYSRDLAKAFATMARKGFEMDSDAIDALGAGGLEYFQEEYGKVKGIDDVQRILEQAFEDEDASPY